MSTYRYKKAISEVSYSMVISVQIVQIKIGIQAYRGLPCLHIVSAGIIGYYANVFDIQIQSTLVISTSVISNNRLSRRENLVLLYTQKSNIR